MLPGGREMDQVKVMSPFLGAHFHFKAVHFCATSLQASLSSAVSLCPPGTGAKELISVLCEFRAAHFLLGCPVGKRITEQSSHV